MEQTMTTHPIDNNVIVHLRRLAEKDEALETALEIADGTGLSVSTVRASLKRLADSGEARTVGYAFNGAKTWALTSDPRFSDR
jgi:DNA-binding Lrp family transcriptional regulator